MRTGFSIATFRRLIPLQQLGRQLSPFPLIQLPYHRLVNPLSLGAILHEVSHNLQNELGLVKPYHAILRVCITPHKGHAHADIERNDDLCSGPSSGLLGKHLFVKVAFIGQIA
jgi:hypothetical protein